jgi:hypothetical protein
MIGGVGMSEHSVANPDTVAAVDHPVPETLVSDRRTLWGSFGKLLFGNVLVIAIVLILMAIFLV